MDNKTMKPASFRPFMREDRQLVIEPAASFTDGVNPLSAAHEKFSRFNFAVIKNGVCSTMNMRWFSDSTDQANCYVEFRELAALAKQLHLQARVNPSKSGGSTPAYTLIFKSGRDTQGKTAVQVLKENPKGRDILSSQRDFLQKNVEKYRSNQQFIDAIDEALLLTPEQINSAESSIELTLFATGLRSNAYKTKGDKVFCYDGSITFYPGADSPLKVYVKNFYANTEKDDKGLSKILMDTADNVTEASINLNFGETLRLFAELDEYFNVKFDELSREGISKSEELIEQGRNSNKNNNSSMASNSANKAPERNDKPSVDNKAKNASKEATEATESTSEGKLKTMKVFTNSSIDKLNDKKYSFTFKVRNEDGSQGNNEYIAYVEADRYKGSQQTLAKFIKEANKETVLVELEYDYEKVNNEVITYVTGIVA